MVQRVLFEGKDKDGKAVASNVVYENAGETRHIRVRREVILAAGVFGSPQLLELSGIGSASS